VPQDEHEPSTLELLDQPWTLAAVGARRRRPRDENRRARSESRSDGSGSGSHVVEGYGTAFLNGFLTGENGGGRLESCESPGNQAYS
jgi:hypothetical protein